MIFARSSLSFAASAVLCACALLSLSAVCVSATVVTAVAFDASSLQNGGTTYGTTEAVTLTVTLESGTATDVAVTVTCGDDATRGTYTQSGAFVLSDDPTGGHGKVFTIPAGALPTDPVSGSIVFTPAAIPDSAEIECSVVPVSGAYASFQWNAGVRAVVTVAADPVEPGMLTEMTLTLYPSNALSRAGAGTVTFNPQCGDSLDVLDAPPPGPARRRLLATTYPLDMVMIGAPTLRWGLLGPAVPQYFDCIFPFTANSGTLVADLAVPDVSVNMARPQPPTWTDFPAAIDLAATYNMTLTLSQANVGGLTLSATCRAAFEVEIALGNFTFLDGEQSRTFPLLGSVFGAPLSGVTCTMRRVSGDAFWTYMSDSSRPAAPFDVVGTMPAGSSSTGASADSSSSSGGSDSSSSSTAAEGAQSSSSTAGPASSSSGPDGASSSTGHDCIPGLTCAALASVRSSWSLIALAAAAVLVGLTQ